MDYENKIDIPFGAKDSELKGWEYTIPEGMEAIIKNGKVIVREKESEDEKLRKAAIEAIEYLEHELCWDAIGDIDILDVKLYLEKQKEPKLASGNSEKPNNQWSEEDNNALDFIHELISFGYTENFFDAQTAADMRKWINSRVHHWKPSEEQMGALEHFIRSWGESGTMSPQNPILCAAKSLYNDIKKLI